MLKAAQFSRMLSRASRVSDPIIYHSHSGGVAIITRRHAYRKGRAMMVVNTPDEYMGILVRKGQYEFSSDGTEIDKLILTEGENSVTLKDGRLDIEGSSEPSIRTLKIPVPDGVTLHIEEGFYKAFLKTAVIHFQGNRVAFYSAEQCNPLYVGILYGDRKLDGILIPTPMMRALLREAFYTSVTFYPTGPRQPIGPNFSLPSVGSDGLGAAISVNGEDGERYTILQAGSIVVSNV